jgi:hypothetical protein
MNVKFIHRFLLVFAILVAMTGVASADTTNDIVNAISATTGTVTMYVGSAIPVLAGALVLMLGVAALIWVAMKVKAKLFGR